MVVKHVFGLKEGEGGGREGRETERRRQRDRDRPRQRDRGSLLGYMSLLENHTLGIFACSGALRMQKLKSHLVRTQSLNVLPLKPPHNHATLTARNFFLISTFPVHSSAFFSKTSPGFFLSLAVANTGSYVGPQNKIGPPA